MAGARTAKREDDLEPAGRRDVARRSVFAIHIRPLKGKLSPLARKLHIAMGRISGAQYRRLDEATRDNIHNGLRAYIDELRSGKRPEVPHVLLQPRFTTTLNELAEAVGYDPKEARHLVDHLKLLKSCEVEYNVLRHGSTNESEREIYPAELEVHCSLLSSLVIGRRQKGAAVVSWGFDPMILGIMVEPRTYTPLNMEILKGVRSYYAVALYENCVRYASLGYTKRLPTATWRRLLIGGPVPQWQDNERELMRIVREAIKDLKACDACDLEIVPEKTNGPSGFELRFLVKLPSQPRLPFGDPPLEDAQLGRQLQDIGFSLRAAKNLMDHHEGPYLRQKLEMLRREQREREVRNPAGWLAAALERDFKNEELANEEERQRAALLEQGRQEAEQLKEAFAAWQAKRIREVYAELPPQQRAQLEQRFGLAPGIDLLKSAEARARAFYGWLRQEQGAALLRDELDRDITLFQLMRPDLKQSAREPENELGTEKTNS